MGGRSSARQWNDILGIMKRQGAALDLDYASLNTLLGSGLEPGRLLILLGAPGGGKTRLANQSLSILAVTAGPSCM